LWPSVVGVGRGALGLGLSGEPRCPGCVCSGQAGASPVACDPTCDRVGSGGGGERSDACERLDEVGLPGPAGGQVNR
jgi:hypothetical protein